MQESADYMNFPVQRANTFEVDVEILFWMHSMRHRKIHQWNFAAAFTATTFES